MLECPKCENKEKINFVSKFYYENRIEIQLICQKCGQVYRERIRYDRIDPIEKTRFMRFNSI